MKLRALFFQRLIKIKKKKTQFVHTTELVYRIRRTLWKLDLGVLNPPLPLDAAGNFQNLRMKQHPCYFKFWLT